ncbi:MAG: nitrilase-related carbon-nitrogen hydrolase, partial [Bacteroidota bacterium]
ATARDGATMRPKGADLILFPELSLTGYTLRDMNLDVALNPGRSAVLKKLISKSKGISIIVGGVEESDSFGLHNSAFFFENGKLLAAHRKVYPPTYGMFEEMRYFSAGRSIRAVDSKLGRLGMLICEDLWHVCLPYLLVQDGAQVILGLSASPTRLGGSQDHPAIATINTENHKVYARVLSTYVVFCNRVGFEDGVNFWGGSEVIDPNGDVLAQAKLFEEDLILAEIDEREVRRARQFSRHFLDDDVKLVLEELRRISRKK